MCLNITEKRLILLTKRLYLERWLWMCLHIYNNLILLAKLYCSIFVIKHKQWLCIINICHYTILTKADMFLVPWRNLATTHLYMEKTQIVHWFWNIHTHKCTFLFLSQALRLSWLDKGCILGHRVQHMSRLHKLDGLCSKCQAIE